MKFIISQQNIYRFTLFIAIIVILLMSVFSYQKIKNLIDFNQRIQHVQEVQKTVEQLFSAIKDAESSLRGFVLSNDSTHITIFNKSLVQINRVSHSLDSVLADNNNQKKTADTLKILVKERLVILLDVLNRRQHLVLPQNKNELLKNLASGKNKMDSIRQVIDQMHFTEADRLEENRVERIKLERITPFFLLLLSSISILLLLVSYFAMSNELHKRVEYGNELARKIGELNRSNTDLEQYAYVASHDLQEPLRKIRSFGDRLVLKHYENLDDDGRSMIAKIQNAAGRMQKLIDDLLSFSRLISGMDKLEYCNTNELVREVLADMEILIKKKNAEIIVARLPVIQAVPSLVMQLFQNIIGNGLKFSKENTRLVISISSNIVKGMEIPGIETSKVNDSYYKIEIADNGIGFDEKYLDRIFVIFQRLNGKMEYEGTGIGLAVCKKIMDIHQGYISAKSKPNAGSTFFLYFSANVQEIK